MNSPLPVYKENYISEIARCIHERNKDHNGKDHKLHMLNHSIGKHHVNVIQNNMKIIVRNFKNNKWKLISESLCIKELRPSYDHLNCLYGSNKEILIQALQKILEQCP